MDDDIGLLSSSSSVTSVTCSSNKKSYHQSMSCGTSNRKQRLNCGSFIRRSSSPSLISSSSRNDDTNHTNRTSMTNDSVSSSNSSVFLEEKSTSHNRLESNKLLKGLQQEANDLHSVSKANASHHRVSYSDDYDSEFNSICNLSKVKIKQDGVDFLNLIHECQIWIEVSEIFSTLGKLKSSLVYIISSLL